MSASIMDMSQTEAYQALADGGETLSAQVFKGAIQTPWRVGSFSALAHGHDAELPDYDSQTINELVLESNQQIALDRFGFPKGAQAGTCLHAIFEFLDFASGDDDKNTTLINKTLLQYGFESQWTQPVKEWFQQVLDTELDPGLKLKQLSQQQRLDELSFYFPVAGLTVESLQAALQPLVTAGTPLARVVERLHFADLTGFMKGFIDLVFEHDGRYYIVDYKSNYLGRSQQAYQADELEQAMVSHDYPLQYLIYSLALHRYLKLRLADYDPQQHLGGVYYLFIRGMKPEWGQAGVFYDQPSAELLDAFDHCLLGVVDD
jgi:exodeoxyribonuclease V beta subunit